MKVPLFNSLFTKLSQKFTRTKSVSLEDSFTIEHAASMTKGGPPRRIFEGWNYPLTGNIRS